MMIRDALICAALFWRLEPFVDPESGKYQLEIFSVYQDHAEDLANLMRKFILYAKVIEHKNGTVTYLQKAEDIMDFLFDYWCYGM